MFLSELILLGEFVSFKFILHDLKMSRVIYRNIYCSVAYSGYIINKLLFITDLTSLKN